MSMNRNLFGTCVLNDTAYVVGGHDDNSTVLNSVESYDYGHNKWSQLCGMKKHRVGLGVYAIDETIYAIGGWNEDQGTLRTAEKYNPETNSWIEITPMHQARAYFDVATKDNYIYVVGGSASGKAMNTIEVYDVKSDTWSILWEVMNVSRSSHCVAMVDLIS